MLDYSFSMIIIGGDFDVIGEGCNVPGVVFGVLLAKLLSSGCL